MLWLRAILFTLAVPCAALLVLPPLADPNAQRRGGLWDLGYAVAAAGAALYGICLLRFLAAGGTPLVFFAKLLKPLFGEEPPELVERGPYRFCRNPMYLGVVSVVFGQAILTGSWKIAVLGALLWLFFHWVVVYLEEPHLRRRHGARYEEYRQKTPRWFRVGRPRKTPLA